MDRTRGSFRNEEKQVRKLNMTRSQIKSVVTIVIQSWGKWRLGKDAEMVVDR